MRSLLKSGVWMGMALLASALVGVTVAAENPSDKPQGSWNDYPTKLTNWIPRSTGNNTPTPPGNGSDEPTTYPEGPVHWGDEADDRRQPTDERGSGNGGIFGNALQNYGNGMIGGRGWGKGKPPRDEEDSTREGEQPTPEQARLAEELRLAQEQNALLREAKQLVDQILALLRQIEANASVDRN